MKNDRSGERREGKKENGKSGSQLKERLKRIKKLKLPRCIIRRWIFLISLSVLRRFQLCRFILIT